MATYDPERSRQAARNWLDDWVEQPSDMTEPARPSPTGTSWPALKRQHALHGLAGEIVRILEPDTEADPAALLVQLLAAFGAMVGRGPHWRVEGVEHHSNLNILLVGETSKGRKGTSWGRVSSTLGRAERCREVSGLSSGEGLKWAVRDPISKMERGQEVIADEGVTDKRLLVQESEFAQVLRACARHGNTLSATIRSAWDSGNLSTLTKSDTVTATGAHISIIGHITSDELRAELTATDAANGFANRFLLVCVKRSKCLPFGGSGLADDVLGNFGDRLEKAAIQARKLGAVDMTEAARTTWAGVYPKLSDGRPGLHGAVTGRAEAQAIRLALLYALLDGAEAIDKEHLLAALAVWDYCDDSASFIFGDSLGDPVADEILKSLGAAGQAGLTRTDISALFKRHQSAARIDAALSLLEGKGLADRRSLKTGGRAVENWTACVAK